MFRELVGDTAIILIKGTYRQCPLYEYQGNLFAKLGSGFIRLNTTGATSRPDALLFQLITEQKLTADKFGRLSVDEKYPSIEAEKLLALTAKGAE